MKPEFILVSQSPRRRELLQQAGFHFISTHVDTPETLSPHLKPEENAQEIAKNKVLTYLYQNPNPNLPLVGADTIVVTKDNEILGKPKDKQQAITFLQKLQDSMHTVITGICIYTAQLQKPITRYESTQVYIAPLSMQEIEHYIDHYQPYDKAGAYGVQDWLGLRHIYKINGCYYNVVGFPVALFYATLKELKQNQQF
ncbi:MAG: Maf family protein [Bacteroidia bacterium]|nr:Maf family protein [Bacteroidia bacterium]